MKYFAYDPDCGFEVFDTEKEAKEMTEKSLCAAREAADDGWNENVTQICYGKITAEVVESVRVPKPKTEDEEEAFVEKYGIQFKSDWYMYLDYAIKRIKAK